MPSTWRIVSIGPLAQRALTGAAAARVTAVFDASFHIASSGGLACVGGPELGNGPLNAVCHSRPGRGWRAEGVAAGAGCRIEAGGLAIAGGPVLDLAGAAPWLPPPWPADWSPARLDGALKALARLAADRLPADGLARTAFGDGAARGLAGVALRTALLATATLSDWLALVLGGAPEQSDADLAAAAQAAVHGLIGLGPGLTPAGDDLLAGLAVALHAAGAADAAAALAGFVRKVPPDATSPLSRAFLEAAVDGLAGEAMCAMISALLAGDEAALPGHLERLDGIGHTSGWDMLAGAVLALAAAAEAGR
jgi:hypothetical protein